MTGDGFDAIVIGGGPAGSSVATYLARAGRHVVLLERERHPRPHIGESLLPGVLPYLDALGVREQIERAGFERKEGQTFVWGKDRTPWEIDFRELDVHPYAFFVDRARFDELLLRHAAASGVDVREETAVTRILFEGGRAIGATYRDRAGQSGAVRGRFVVDASGQSALVARGAGLRRIVRGLKNTAVWAYWDGAARLPDHRRTHILTVSIPEGWVWVIPLGDRTSIGIVTSSATRADRERLGASVWYETKLQTIAELRDVLAGARRVTDVAGAKDWSYRSRRFAGAGLFLVGDAACFIDPILSTGVHLAMTAAHWAAAAIHSALLEPKHEAFFRSFFEQTYENAYAELLTQVKAFYQAEGRRDSIFWAAKKLLRLDDAVRPDLAFLFICAGLLRNAATASPHEPAAQIKNELGGRVALPLGDRAPAADRAALRPAEDGGRLVSFPLVWKIERGDRAALVSVRADGLRLVLVPHEPKGITDRPKDSYFAVELVDEHRWPQGLLLVEQGNTKGAHAVRVLRYRTGALDEHDARAIETEARAIVARVAPGRAIPIARARVRAALRAAGNLPGGIRADLRARRGGGAHDPPLTAVYRAVDRRAVVPRVYFVLERRVPPELTEVPLLRAPHVDVWLRPRSSRDGRELVAVDSVAKLVDTVIASLRSALARPASSAASLAAAESALRRVRAGGYELEACGRIGVELAASEGRP